VPRSGSWLLAEGLHNTRIAGVPEEYFRQDYYKFFLDRWREPRLGTHTDFLADAIRAGTTPNGVFSIKIHWVQLVRFLNSVRFVAGYETASAAALVAEFFPNPHYVHLVRQDKVRQAISYYRAIRTNVWWRLEGESTQERPDRTPHDLDQIDRLKRLLMRQEASWRGYFREAGISPLLITYEEMTHAYEATIRKVLEYLQVRIADDMVMAKPRLIKQADQETEDLVHRYLAMRRSAIASAAGWRWPT
jgi:trehalose 2-sulfotransferase